MLIHSQVKETIHRNSIWRFAKAHRSLGISYARRNEPAKAFEHYQRYLELDPNAEDAESVRELLRVIDSDAPQETESTAPKIIREAMKASREKFRACYEAELAKNPEFAASVMLHFTIEQDGTTSNVTSDPLTGVMDACLQKQVRAMKFNLYPSDGGKIQVNYPLRFAPEAPSAKKASSSLTKEQVLKVVKGVVTSDAVNDCLKGKEALAKWTIGFDGHVTGVSFGVTPDDGGQTSACLKPLIEAMRFPASDGVTPVTFPLHGR